ncbi:MAG: ABC transporter ATP-binding protein [Pirellulaceae bacterium]|nr:ABC transporter ATP-binding protein [Pirellulaceae bacterium]MDP7018473.1 ABC transporter ATP-binding protein [Pirellulaceae bacterium]
MTDDNISATEQNSVMVEISGLHVQFASQEVLRDVDLAVPRGQTLAVIGESGCGKTVLLKTMIGLLKPHRGTVLFDGRDLSTLNERELTQQRTRIGFVFQNAALFDSLTVGQNVAFPIRQHKQYAERQVRELVLERLEEVGLPSSIVTKKPAELSGGMRKRVGLARALVMNPEVLLYDEPTTGLDPIVSDVINELIIRTRRRYPVTSILVTHDMRTARKVADRVVMMYPAGRLEPNESQMIFDGPPSELERTTDRRVSQFVRGEAGERLMEMMGATSAANGEESDDG